MKKNKIKIFRLLVILLSLLLTLNIFEYVNKSRNTTNDEFSEMQVHFIDVGQGDCTLITSGGEAMLIDAGNNDKGTLVQSYLQKQGITSLDIVICTHGDGDHSGGIDVILYKFDCKTVIMPDTSKVMNDTATFRDVLSTMKAKNYKNTVPVIGDVYKLGNATVTIIAPSSYDYGDNKNNYSVGVLVQNGENRFIFTGDAQAEAEVDILHNNSNISADVYKVAHHGSRTSTTKEFLDAINPTYAVISCGEDNSYGHPHAEVMKRLRKTRIKVFRTDVQGTIIAISDGRNITWNRDSIYYFPN